MLCCLPRGGGALEARVKRLECKRRRVGLVVGLVACGAAVSLPRGLRMIPCTNVMKAVLLARLVMSTNSFGRTIYKNHNIPMMRILRHKVPFSFVLLRSAIFVFVTLNYHLYCIG